ncbi:4-deoxy-L-threo-5-hexosulose-uronate ketol-isomerase [Pseudopedobacter saltans DSM 12145]|uniref:4-deoxy-L-threo-5-hexosulose-uronate ketol-isomerase n=1 Tax=Pseudopedobacter saltans (strain ATCC 51119 / DSM 12145 / JCM 21818 / CCUG 39354 / LMG 10337 / NBRC 100064 / NCIMB 13643) TaxID=762903 RepID=F0S843_PSESL|nr:5-dehydro-4-deoxy-D-glucuronate isomerase [Pseudopedobacter saltans]ADY52305.1 4-deoxy-L-threo-5-hexosulose-uronate ketol-isomerase [Pseudopedobacter saltans DSM 12145]
MKYTEKYAVHPADFKNYDTQRIREEFLIPKLFEADEIVLEYSLYDRYIVGGINPVSKALKLETFDSLKAPYFLERRELGIINVGGKGIIKADGEVYEIGYKEALYLGQGTVDITFESADANTPAKFYINSAPAHKKFPNKKVTQKEGKVIEAGSVETCNKRKIYQLLINTVLETCQLQMGLTELQTGSVWNTMPAHTHNRRMEAYFYFEVPENQAVCHYMGQPQETRHVWMNNEQAIWSPSWSIHSGSGTSNYTFIWGMAGENLDYGDMDVVQPNELR